MTESVRAQQAILKLKGKSKRTVDSLLRYSEHEDDLVRNDSIEKLDEIFSDVDVIPESVRDVVAKSLHDVRDLVRCSALDFLEKHPTSASFDEILDLLRQDESVLVRARAALVLGAMRMADAIPFLRERISCAQDYEKFGLLAALDMLGEHEAFSAYLDLLVAPDYQVRCAVANNLVLLVNDDRIEVLRDKLRTALKRETVFAAEVSLKRALSMLDER